MWLREISPGEREMATSGGEREERQAWTHDNFSLSHCSVTSVECLLSLALKGGGRIFLSPCSPLSSLLRSLVSY